MIYFDDNDSSISICMRIKIVNYFNFIICCDKNRFLSCNLMMTILIYSDNVEIIFIIIHHQFRDACMKSFLMK